MAITAIDALALMYINLKGVTNSEVDVTGDVLLPLLVCDKKIIKKRVDVALDCMVQYCDYRKVIRMLVNVGHK